MASLPEQGILRAEIYLLGTRMVMVLATTDDFSFAAKAASDQANRKVQEWEKLMWKFPEKNGYSWKKSSKHNEHETRIDRCFDGPTIIQEKGCNT